MKQPLLLSAALAIFVVGCVAACGGKGDEPRIAFIRSFGTAPADIYVMNADGTGERRLTQNPGWDGYPAWSPDGGSIAFDSERDGSLGIFVMNADGSGQRRLTRNPGGDGMPAWSPNGSRIAFASWRLGRHIHPDVYVMNADGSGQRRLTRSPANDVLPAWSPDGRRIAFASKSQWQLRGLRDERRRQRAAAADAGTGRGRISSLVAQEPVVACHAVLVEPGLRDALLRRVSHASTTASSSSSRSSWAR